MKRTLQPSRQTPGRFALSFSLLGGGVAWLLHLLLSYLVAEFGCLAGWGEVSLFGVSAVAWLLLLMSGLTAVLAGAAILISWRCEKDLPAAGDEKPDAAAGSKGFTARTGFVANLFFLFVILMESVPIFYFLHGC